MVINTNAAAQSAAGLLGESSQRLATSLARLSSGSKLVSPEDDAAGLAVSLRFDAQIHRTSAAMGNLGNAISFSQTQDGFLKKIGRSLDRMSELAVLAQDVTKTDNDRVLYNQEFQTLATYINDATAKDFNGVSLFSSDPLNVTTDSEGGTFQMQGISGNYIAGATQPGAAVPRPLSATMGELIPGFNAGAFVAWDGSSSNFAWSVTSGHSLATLATRLDHVLSLGGSNPNGFASYDTQTGQLSLTLGADEVLTYTTDHHIAGSDDVLSGLGFSLSDLDNSGATTPKTVSVMLTTPGPVVPSSAPDISTLNGASSALTTVETALDQLTTDRATVGANLTRLNYTTEQLATLNNNLAAANSRLKDVDVAEESTQFARYNILVQAGTAMLSQANSMPQSVLRLLG